MHRPVASCLVHEEKLSPFDMFYKLKYIKQCNFVITFLQWKDDGWLRRGGCDGLDSEVYLFILDSCQFEAAVGSNDSFISCHVLGSVEAMLWFIHSVGLLKLACWFWCMHANNQSFPTLARVARVVILSLGERAPCRHSSLPQPQRVSFCKHDINTVFKSRKEKFGNRVSRILRVPMQ